MFGRWSAFCEVGPLIVEYALDLACAATYLLCYNTRLDSDFFFLTIVSLILKHTSVTQGTNVSDKPHSPTVLILGLLGCLPLVFGYRHSGSEESPVVFTNIYLLYGSFGFCPSVAAMLTANLAEPSWQAGLFAARAAVGICICARATFLLNRVNRYESEFASSPSEGFYYTPSFQAAIENNLPWAYYCSLMFARVTSWVVAFISFPKFFAAGALFADFFATAVLAFCAYSRSTSEKCDALRPALLACVAYALVNPDEFNLAYRNLLDFHRSYFTVRLASLVLLNGFFAFYVKFKAPRAVFFCWIVSVVFTVLYALLEILFARKWRSVPEAPEDQRLLARTTRQSIWLEGSAELQTMEFRDVSPRSSSPVSSADAHLLIRAPQFPSIASGSAACNTVFPRESSTTLSDASPTSGLISSQQPVTPSSSSAAVQPPSEAALVQGVTWRERLSSYRLSSAWREEGEAPVVDSSMNETAAAQGQGADATADVEENAERVDGGIRQEPSTGGSHTPPASRGDGWIDGGVGDDAWQAQQ
eukprot:GEMP01008463.1.p1 GENE.GEMP01008463.1~~GEMP01008463.1.p1  ORF type:complete len:532 (+),score=113.10 GEMP01008463.1:69-1664(+)